VLPTIPSESDIEPDDEVVARSPISCSGDVVANIDNLLSSVSQSPKGNHSCGVITDT